MQFEATCQNLGWKASQLTHCLPTPHYRWENQLGHREVKAMMESQSESEAEAAWSLGS